MRIHKPQVRGALYKYTVQEPLAKRVDPKKYLRILALRRIQFNRFMPGAGRRQAPHPSGTGKGVSRHQRATISGRGRRVTNINIAVGGARGYHDADKKPVYKLNKKEQKLAIATLFMDVFSYANTYWAQRMPAYNQLLQSDELGSILASRCGIRQDRTYNRYRKACLVIHTDSTEQRLLRKAFYKRAGFSTVNVQTGENYRALELNAQSRHGVVITEPAMRMILTRYFDAL